MGRLIVTASAVVLPTADGREQYLYKGAVVDADAFTEKGVEHARTQGLIDDAPEVIEDEVEVFTQADIDLAKQLVEDEAKKVGAAKDALDQERAAFEAEKAAFAAEQSAKVETVKPAAKPASGKQV